MFIWSIYHCENGESAIKNSLNRRSELKKIVTELQRRLDYHFNNKNILRWLNWHNKILGNKFQRRSRNRLDKFAEKQLRKQVTSLYA